MINNFSAFFYCCVCIQSQEPSLMDDYEYVMHGKVFKVDQVEKKDVSEMCVSLILFTNVCTANVQSLINTT